MVSMQFRVGATNLLADPDNSEVVAPRASMSVAAFA
jgi:hypothetical protein